MTGEPDVPKPADARQSATAAAEMLSSVEIDTTAKGDPKVRVKVYATSNDVKDVQAAADKATDLYLAIRGRVARDVQEAE